MPEETDRPQAESKPSTSILTAEQEQLLERLLRGVYLVEPIKLAATLRDATEEQFLELLGEWAAGLSQFQEPTKLSYFVRAFTEYYKDFKDAPRRIREFYFQTIDTYLHLIGVSPQEFHTHWETTWPIAEKSVSSRKANSTAYYIYSITALEGYVPGIVKFFNEHFKLFMFEGNKLSFYLNILYRDWQRYVAESDGNPPLTPIEWWADNVEKILLASGLSPEDLTELDTTWQSCGPEYFTTVHLNVVAIQQLVNRQQLHHEAEIVAHSDEASVDTAPPIVPTLMREFGIHCFYRYDSEMLFNQYQQRNAAGPYGVIVYPKTDYNHAFAQDNKRFAQLEQEVGPEYKVRIVEVGDELELLTKLVEFRRRYRMAGDTVQKISFVILGGHGRVDRILLGYDHGEPQYLDGLDFVGPRAKLRRKMFFAPHVSVILSSCNTGADLGLAEQIHASHDITISAPTIPTSLKTIHIEKKALGINLRAEYHGPAETDRFLPASNFSTDSPQ